MTITEKEIELIKKISEKLIYGSECLNENQEYITRIKELKLSQDEFETFSELLKKIFSEEEYEYAKGLLGFFLYTSWEF